jgi:hypothetical protein
LLDHDGAHGTAGLRNIFLEAMAIEALAPQRQQQRTTDIWMRTQLVHHPVSVSIGVAAPKADQVNLLSFERIYDLAGYMMSAFHEVGDNDTVSDPFSSVGTKKTLQRRRVI